ncbi:hypothetical protein NXZ75_06815 [Lysinibacillus sphaericus]|uniref:hypothetical protein n=1 Tax=Lysinibacillus sphaericus TaxID=1421 RepID=UPI002162DC02|nr:hypothetical protein [Lysinibacillus sphaericus]MCS1381899.1 hypothetical protein [Lysinibacillus sphaericus]
MSKIPIKPILKTMKTLAPKVIFVKENPDKVVAAAGGLGKLGKAGMDTIKSKEERFDRRALKGKVPFRKRKFIQYQNEILPNLDSYSYTELISYKHEVENYIKQINQEEDDQLVVNKPLNSKRRKSWEKIYIQIEDKIKSKNYVEFLKVYNSSSYTSDYFEDKIIKNIRNIENKDELYKYIIRYTERDLKEIEKDFC